MDGDLFRITVPDTLGEIVAVMKGERRREKVQMKRLDWVAF
jgi:hypothetical protein